MRGSEAGGDVLCGGVCVCDFFFPAVVKYGDG